MSRHRFGRLLLSIISGLVFASCAVVEEAPLKTSGDLVYLATAQISEVTPAELAGEDDTLVIDVSEAGEYAAGHLPGAINVPRGTLEFRIDSLEPLRALSQEQRRTHPIVVYCSHGSRGTLSAKTLQDMGYANVRALRGGLLAWKTEGYAVEPLRE